MEKLVLVLLAICAVTQGKPYDSKSLEMITKICRKETGMSADIIKKATDKQTLPAPTATYLKYLECSYKKQGFIDENEDIVYNEIKQMLSSHYSEPLIDSVIEPCKIKREGSVGQKAYTVASCIVNGLLVKEQELDNVINNEIKDD